jgi:hypothetical protein
LVRSLAAPGSGLTQDATVLAILPSTLDTPNNRKFMPAADTSTWTPLEVVAQWVSPDLPTPLILPSALCMLCRAPELGPTDSTLTPLTASQIISDMGNPTKGEEPSVRQSHGSHHRGREDYNHHCSLITDQLLRTCTIPHSGRLRLLGAVLVVCRHVGTIVFFRLLCTQYIVNGWTKFYGPFRFQRFGAYTDVLSHQRRTKPGLTALCGTAVS